MSRTQIFISAGILLLLANSLTACSALATPRQIAMYPLSTPYPQPGITRAYDTYLELEVNDAEEAAESAIQQAYQVGGLLLESSSGQQGEYKYETLVLAIPVDDSQAFQFSLLQLGTPIQERLSSRMISRPGQDSNTNVYITVQLQEKRGGLPASPPTGWHQTRLLTRLWNIFFAIFRFMVEIEIWIVVVLGPVLLIALAVWAMIRCYRARHVSRM